MGEPCESPWQGNCVLVQQPLSGIRFGAMSCHGASRVRVVFELPQSTRAADIQAYLASDTQTTIKFFFYR